MTQVVSKCAEGHHKNEDSDIDSKNNIELLLYLRLLESVLPMR